MSESIAVTKAHVDSFEGFHKAVYGSHVDVVQLQRGKLRGTLTHIGIGGFSLSIGSFSHGIRAQRIASDNHLIVGMLLSAAAAVTHWSYDMNPGDVLVIPPGVEHDGRFFGGSSYAAMRFDPADIASTFEGDSRLSDPATWMEKNRFRANPRTGAESIRRLNRIIEGLLVESSSCSPRVTDFWRRSMVDAFATSVMHALPPDDPGWVPSAGRLVRDVEAYIAAGHEGPVHISEICAQFGVSRRSLYRAFDEVLGMGPVTFLRQKRLCAVHSVLQKSDPRRTTVTQVAMTQGFIELGRFAYYYHMLFGERPSETLGARPVKRSLAAARHYELPANP
nr:helix-turn-helix domain-containing protein [Tardiphaga sp.]